MTRKVTLVVVALMAILVVVVNVRLKPEVETPQAAVPSNTAPAPRVYVPAETAERKAYMETVGKWARCVKDDCWRLEKFPNALCRAQDKYQDTIALHRALSMVPKDEEQSKLAVINLDYRIDINMDDLKESLKFSGKSFIDALFARFKDKVDDGISVQICDRTQPGQLKSLELADILAEIMNVSEDVFAKAYPSPQAIEHMAGFAIDEQIRLHHQGKKTASEVRASLRTIRKDPDQYIP